MLTTTIRTTDEATGREIPVPADLLARVSRAADILAEVLHKVASKIDINARWWFEAVPGSEPAVLLGLSVEDGACLKPFPYPREALRDDESIRRELWKPINYLFPKLDEVVDRRFESVRRGLEALATSEE